MNRGAQQALRQEKSPVTNHEAFSRISWLPDLGSNQGPAD